MIGIDLSGKVALVTGASGQLGRVMAVTLAQAGADVAVHYNNNHQGAEKVGEEIAKMSRKFCLIMGDVADPAAVEVMHETVVRELGEVDILVTNAVAQYPWKPVLDQPLADYESQFRTCVLQNVVMAKAFTPAMIQKKWGRVIAISTECVMQVFPTQSAYTAGKKGMDAVLRVLAREIGEHGITVNQVAPGWTISERDRTTGSEQQEHYSKNVPLRRRGEDQEIANTVAFLASDLASVITGVYLPVCGGNVMPAV
jgi:3-oxoacyl-[acyl-carrier protein] reductase